MVGRLLISLVTCAVVAGACAATSSAPSASAAAPSALASPVVVCDTAAFQPTPSLTCGPALAAALAVLPTANRPLIREEFRWGGLCPPDAPCAPPLGDAGIVIVTFASGPAVFVDVQAAGGVVSVSSPAPYPSGY